MHIIYRMKTSNDDIIFYGFMFDNNKRKIIANNCERFDRTLQYVIQMSVSTGYDP